MATSSISAFKSKFQIQLQARAGLSGVEIGYGPPLPSARPEYVGLGPCKGDEDWALIGSKQREERFTATLWVSVLKKGRGQTLMQQATNRAFVLVAELEAQLRTDPTVNQAASAFFVAEIKGVDLDEFADDQSLEAVATVRIGCKARI